jgi:hypothetical protein
MVGINNATSWPDTNGKYSGSRLGFPHRCCTVHTFGINKNEGDIICS